MHVSIMKCDPRCRHVVTGPLGEYRLYREGKGWSCKYSGPFGWNPVTDQGLKDVFMHCRKPDVIEACRARLRGKSSYELLGG